MKALLDTSTLIAAMLPDHVHHSQALPWLAQAKSGAFEFICSGHSLAENLRGSHAFAANTADQSE